MPTKRRSTAIRSVHPIQSGWVWEATDPTAFSPCLQVVLVCLFALGGLAAVYIFGIRKHNVHEQLSVVTRRVEFVRRVMRNCWDEPYVDIKLGVRAYLALHRARALACRLRLCPRLKNEHLASTHELVVSSHRRWMCGSKCERPVSKS